MDTLTHALSGALVGRIMSSKAKVLKPSGFILAGALAATFPDFDFIFRLFGSEVYLWNHRGITHSLFFVFIWAAFSAFLATIYLSKSSKKDFWFIEPNDKINKRKIFKDIYFLSIISILMHIFGDMITSFGTMLFWPIMNRYDFGSVFIIDLFFTGIIVVGLLSSMWFGTTTKQKSKIALLTSIVLFSYVGLTQIFKVSALNEMKVRLEQKYPDFKDNLSITYDVQPQMYAPTNWTGIAYDKNKEVYYFSSIKLIGDDKKIIDTYNKWGENKEVTQKFYNNKSLEFARWFMKHPFVIQESEKCVTFSDMRYKSPYREENPFTYMACEK